MKAIREPWVLTLYLTGRKIYSLFFLGTCIPINTIVISTTIKVLMYAKDTGQMRQALE